MFLSLYINSRCLAKTNNIFRHLGTECEHPQLKLKVSQLTVTQTHLTLPIYTHRTHSNQKPAFAAMHGPHSVFDIGHCTVIHCDAGGVSLIDQ